VELVYELPRSEAGFTEIRVSKPASEAPVLKGEERNAD